MHAVSGSVETVSEDPSWFTGGGFQLSMERWRDSWRDGGGGNRLLGPISGQIRFSSFEICVGIVMATAR
ncbi:hypothetical protein YC2023_005624 [Brassica napus]